MSVKVVILRRVPAEKTQVLKPLLIKLRSLALEQPGYISGETWISRDNPEEALVISNWDSEKEWDAWLRHSEREKVQSEIDGLLGRRTRYQVYYAG
jgi:heme-degrading monooxygenase HmoA